MTATEFLQAIFRDCEGGDIEFRFLPSKNRVFWPLQKLPGLPVFPAEQNIYFTPALRNSGGKKEHIVEIACLWSDIDFKQTSQQDADKRLRECPCVPSANLSTGGGYHCYWFLREPRPKEDIENVESFLRRLTRYIGGDQAACDASHILRVPGTVNQKYNHRPEVKILFQDPSLRYDLSDFEEWLPEDPKKKTSKGQFKNQPGWQNSILPGVSEGSRHQSALKLAGRYFAMGLDPSEVKQILFHWNLANTPPLEESELDRILRDVEAMHGKGEVETEKTTPRGFTDLQNADRFAEKHKGKIRFCHKFNKWLHWTGTRWEIDETGDIWRTAKNHILSMLEIAGTIQDDKERASFLKEMAKLQNETKLEAMVSLARHVEGIPVTPEGLDKDPLFFNCESGTVDLRTFEYLQHKPENLITKLSPFTIAKTADCPKWRGHLNLIMNCNRELTGFLQRAFGSCLAGDNRNRKLFLLWGNGANGKSVTLETIHAILGDYAMKTPAETLLVKRFESIPNDLARLNGARFVYTSEVADGKKLAEALVKELSGDKYIQARFMRGEWFDILVTFKIFLATNHLPTIRGTDPAIWDRIMLIPFTVRIPEEQRRSREELIDEFKAEGPAILKWLLEGCHEWLNEGLKPPPEVLAANADYRGQMDTLRQFIEDQCLTGERVEVRSADLYKAYEKWTIDNGEDPMKKIAFGRRLREKGYRDFRDTQGLRAWRGLGLIRG